MPRRLLLLLVVAFLPAAAPPPTVPVYRQFGRWIVACDNVRRCVARGFDETSSAQLDLVRAAGDARATLRFFADGAINADAVRLDGGPIAFPSPAWSAKGGDLSTDDLAAVAAFIARVRDGHTVTLDPAASRGRPARIVPLDGFTAALLLVDAVQDRTGTPTALVANKGTAAPPPAPPLPSTPRWTPPPPLSRAESGRLAQQAGRLSSPTGDGCNGRTTPEVHALDAANALAIRPCAMGAYQGSAIVAVLPRRGGPAKPLRLLLPGLPRDGTTGPDMVEPTFDPAIGTLSTFSKGRGLADCGLSAAWVWSGGAFHLLSLSFQDQCGGAEPGDWLPLFRRR